MRLAQEAREMAAALVREKEAECKIRERIRKQQAMEVRITAMRKELEAEEEEANRLAGQEQAKERMLFENCEAMARSRHDDAGQIPARSRKRR